MNGKGILVDTNVIIYALTGDRKVQDILRGHRISISVVSEIELKSFRFKSPQDEIEVCEFIEQCVVLGLEPETVDMTARCRRNFKLKLPDAIIAATSLVCDLPLFTADMVFMKVSGIELMLSKPST